MNKDKMNLSTLRSIQGLHAPLKLQMEYRAARQVTASLELFILLFLLVLMLFFAIPANVCPTLPRSSVCHSYRVQTWRWTHCEAVTTLSVLRTSSMVRHLFPHLHSIIDASVWIWFLTSAFACLFPVTLQIQPRVKWWVSHIWWWNTSWDYCEWRWTAMIHLDLGLLFVRLLSVKKWV